MRYQTTLGAVLRCLIGLNVLGLLPAVLPSASADDEPFGASQQARQLDARIDWSKARLIVVQDAGRFKTLDAFAREAFADMYGDEHLPGLTPMASLCEWIFNSDAYADAPVIKIRDRGMQIHFAAGNHFSESERRRILTTGMMTPREMTNRVVLDRLAELEPRNTMGKAISRVRNAQAIAMNLPQALRIVPEPGAGEEALWYTPEETVPNLPDSFWQQVGLDRSSTLRAMRVTQAAAGITPAQAVAIAKSWFRLKTAWIDGNAAAVQESLDSLASYLPTMAADGVYPEQSRLQAEAKYYHMGKLTWGYIIYLFAAITGIMALVTGWRWPWIKSIIVLLIAMGFHAYGLYLRWYIQGRIPVANMFEAIVASAWMGVALGLVLELVYRKRFFLVGSAFVGFFALVLGQFVLPGTLQPMMGILDDVLLRIHTVLIIWSYALIALAAIIAVIYLFGYYSIMHPGESAFSGMLCAFFGACMWMVARYAFTSADIVGVATESGLVKKPGVEPAFWVATAVVFVLMLVLYRLRAPGLVHVVFGNVLVACLALAVAPMGFITSLGLILLIGGVVWAVATSTPRIARALWSQQEWRFPWLLAAQTGAQGLATEQVTTFGRSAAPDLLAERPILAGGMPGDERSMRHLPKWLHDADWAHLIVLNMVFIMLFVGVILGAVWADYSWGRPWGWDPKEVFALNTWLIYAVLIHSRFITKKRGLATAWLSVGGCLMMAFNWCVVNFYIVGLHSYA